MPATGMKVPETGPAAPRIRRSPMRYYVGPADLSAGTRPLDPRQVDAADFRNFLCKGRRLDCSLPGEVFEPDRPPGPRSRDGGEGDSSFCSIRPRGRGRRHLPSGFGNGSRDRGQGRGRRWPRAPGPAAAAPGSAAASAEGGIVSPGAPIQAMVCVAVNHLPVVVDDGEEHAVVIRLEVHRDLVRLDDGDRLALGDRVSHLLEPADDGPFLHGHSRLGHDDRCAPWCPLLSRQLARGLDDELRASAPPRPPGSCCTGSARRAPPAGGRAHRGGRRPRCRRSSRQSRPRTRRNGRPRARSAHARSASRRR